MINKYLSEEGSGPLIPDDHQSWTVRATNQFIEIAIQGFDWDYDNHILFMQFQDWPRIVEQNPELFNPTG